MALCELDDEQAYEAEISQCVGVSGYHHWFFLKALAAGANACSIGRPYLFALAAGGEAGVERALTLLRAEIERDMALMGAAKIGDVNVSFLRKRYQY